MTIETKAQENMRVCKAIEAYNHVATQGGTFYEAMRRALEVGKAPQPDSATSADAGVDYKKILGCMIEHFGDMEGTLHLNVAPKGLTDVELIALYKVAGMDPKSLDAAIARRG